MNFQALFFIVGLLIREATMYSVPTCSQISDMSSTLISEMLATDTTSSLNALALRLGFHDCVGGCDGCVNLDNDDNAGLDEVVEGLQSVYYSYGYDDIVSLADFYALATTVSISNAVKIANIARSGSSSSPCPLPCFTLRWGRTDTADCSDDYTELPAGTMTGDEMFTYFADYFGFSRDQVVALMGAHSFGGASSSNSGYSGKWTGSQNKGLSEVYYSNMISSSITFSNTNAGNSSYYRYQFTGKLSNGTAAGFMLNTDFELFYNLTLNSKTYKTTCTLSNTCGLTDSCSNYCAKATTFDTAYTYAQNCTAFMEDFVDVIELMLMNGYSSSDLTESDDDSCDCS